MTRIGVESRSSNIVIFIRFWKSTLRYHLFRCMTAMLYALIQWYPAYGPVALQSYKKILGNVTYFFRIRYLPCLLICYFRTLFVCERGRVTALAFSPGNDMWSVLKYGPIQKIWFRGGSLPEILNYVPDRDHSCWIPISLQIQGQILILLSVFFRILHSSGQSSQTFFSIRQISMLTLSGTDHPRQRPSRSWHPLAAPIKS